MLAGRGVAVFVAGIAMWLAARFLGSPGLEVVAIGIAALPLIASFAAKRGAQRISVRRRLSDVRISPGSRVTVTLDVENRSPVGTSFLLLEDRLPTPPRTSGAARDRWDPCRETGRGDVHAGPAVARALSPRTPRDRRVGSVRAEPGAPGVRRTGGTAGRPRDRGPRHRPRSRLGAVVRRVACPTAVPDRPGVLHDAVLSGGRRPAEDPLALRRPDGRADDPSGRDDPSGERARVPRHAGRRARPDADPGVRTRGLRDRLGRRPPRPPRLRAPPRHHRAPRRGAVRGALPRRAHRDLARGGAVDRAGIGPPPLGLLTGHVARVRLRTSRSRRAERADPRRRGLRSEARDLDPSDRSAALAAGAAGAARRPGEPGPAVPRPSRVGRPRPAPRR